MKIFRVLLIFFIVLIINLTQPCGLKAQSSLQFNQAILVSTSQTVPVGMVWKVESVIASNQLAPGLAYNVNAGATKSIVILINGSNAYVKTWDEKNYVNGGAYSAASGTVTDLPLWLPAGTTLEASTNTLYISVLEFKISP
jgi:hypothetical protein